MLVSSDEAATITNNGAPGWDFGNRADRYVQDSKTGSLTDPVRCLLDIVLVAMHYNL